MKRTTVRGGASSAHRKGGARSSAPRATVGLILDAAHRVLIKHGYAKFTTRRVAQAAAISPGNLSYHFPSKRELLRAVIARLVADYSRQFEESFSDPSIRPEQELGTLVQWLLKDAIAEETVRIFRELWAMSLHDAFIRRAVDDLYDELMNHVVKLLMRSKPDANLAAIRELVQLMALISEGSIVLYGTRRKRVVPHERITALVTSLIGVIAPDLHSSAASKGEPPN